MTDSLAGAIFWVAVALCAVAQLALLHSFFLGASRPAAGVPRGFRITETLWALLPAVALVALFASSWQAMQAPEAGAALRAQPAVGVEAPATAAAVAGARRVP